MGTDEDTWIVGPRLEEFQGEESGDGVGTSEVEDVDVIGSKSELDEDSRLLGSVGVAEGFKSRAASVSIVEK
jgi:hypothetical protein